MAITFEFRLSSLPVLNTNVNEKLMAYYKLIAFTVKIVIFNVAITNSILMKYWRLNIVN